jgi:catechol-2,3-dioxygenase
MTGIRRLNHAVLFVSDVDVAATFYTGVLGFSEVTRIAPMQAVFLRAADSANHHDLGLFGLGTDAAAKRQRTIGLYHLAWQVDTIDQLASLRTALIDSGGYTGESSHGATKSVYGADPDGNEFELMWMVPRADWGRYAEVAVVDRLDLAAEIERWSGIGTADELGAIGAEGHVTGPIPLS